MRTRAVHELLLRERQQLAVLEEVLALERACCREGPARAAHALVLHWSDCALLSPVQLCVRGSQESQAAKRRARTEAGGSAAFNRAAMCAGGARIVVFLLEAS
jgi:hypothetical protein